MTQNVARTIEHKIKRKIIDIREYVVDIFLSIVSFSNAEPLLFTRLAITLLYAINNAYENKCYPATYMSVLSVL